MVRSAYLAIHKNKTLQIQIQGSFEQNLNFVEITRNYDFFVGRGL